MKPSVFLRTFIWLGRGVAAHPLFGGGGCNSVTALPGACRFAGVEGLGLRKVEAAAGKIQDVEVTPN